MSLTPTEMQIIREEVRRWGVLSMAAAAIGWSSRQLKATVARDPDLEREVEEALEDHREALYAQAVKRATVGQVSDTVLVKLLEAQLPEQFDSKARNAAVTAKTRPTGVTLRQFKETAEGEVVDAEVKPAAPAAPAEPLKLGFINL